MGKKGRGEGVLRGVDDGRETERTLEYRSSRSAGIHALLVTRHRSPTSTLLHMTLCHWPVSVLNLSTCLLFMVVSCLWR